MRFKAVLCLVLLSFVPSVLIAKAKKHQLPWEIGEKLTFSIRWGIITCGYAHLEVIEKIQLASRDTFRMVSTARSASFFDPFYKVRDRVESYMDAEKLHTVRYEQSNREGGYKKDLIIIYDHEHKTAYENGKKFEITEGVQDVLSALYYLRTKKLEVGKQYEFDVGTGRKNWPLIVEVLRREKIKVPDGTYKTIVVSPKLREEGIFKAKGDLLVWLSDDNKKFPVQMKSDIEFGTISAVLIEKRLEKK